MLEILQMFVSPIFNLAEKLAPELHERMVGLPVKYGDTIRLMHVMTKYALHSHGINYSHPGSSRQQQVTAYGRHDFNDYWLIKEYNKLTTNKKNGEPIRHGDIVRLEHVATGRNLHSHDAPSPLTKQQEVTAFGDDGIGDTNDLWRIEVDGKGVWFEKKKIRLIHLNTNNALHSHAGHSHPEFTAGQQEVTCFTERNNDDFWVIDR